jgi:DNA-binding response OmpR family regulator
LNKIDGYSKIKVNNPLINHFKAREQAMTTVGDDRPAVFLIEEDDDTRPLMRINLERAGYRVLLALDEEDAMERVGGKQINVDLVLINLVGKTTDEVLKIGKRICEHAKFDGHTPLVIVAEKYGKDIEGTDVNVGENDWITYLEDPNQLENLLARLLSRPSVK